MGVGYAPTWLDPLQIARISTQPVTLGTTFVLHACLLDEKTHVGVVVGGTYAVGEAGVEMLCRRGRGGPGDVLMSGPPGVAGSVRGRDGVVRGEDPSRVVRRPDLSQAVV